MSDLVERLRALVILDEVGSNNPLGREAADEIERLRGLLKECADDLADELNGRYAHRHNHPGIKARYERDMQQIGVIVPKAEGL
jgi:hypothetical protein